jgi:transposase InsO family protein
MQTYYYQASQPGSYGGVRPLIRYTGAAVKSAKDWLSSQDAYTLHKPVRKHFPRRKTYAKGIGDLFQADLVDMQSLSRHNDGFRYILTCIDVFSKRAFAVALKDKRGSSIVGAFERIFLENTPNMLQSDRGSEFLNVEVQTLFRKYNIHHYWSFNDDIKAACVERFNRTLKTRMYRYMTYHHSNRWVDALDDLIRSYNTTFHRSIGMAPIEVTTDKQDEIARRLYPAKPKPVWKFELGDTVRISKYKHVFMKGYKSNWSDELFKIVIRYPTFPVTYGLHDLSGDEIKGRFYEYELQKVNKTDDVYDVEKVIKTRRRNGKLEYFVRWKGYPKSFDSWTTDVYKF